MKKHIVPDGIAEMSLRAYLRRAYPMLSQSVLRAALKNHDVKVGGLRGRESVSGGDEICVYLPDALLCPDAKIIYEDERLMVMDKPPGLPSDADENGIGEDTALIRARRVCPDARLAHRLDAGTGGALIFVKSEDEAAPLIAAFRDGSVKKEYLAVVSGKKTGGGRMEDYLKKDARQAFVSVVPKGTAGSVQALAEYEALDNQDGLSLLRVRLLTGRTHQIRVQLASRAMPILGDDKYGDRDINRTLGFASPLLWCREIELDGRKFTSKPHGRGWDNWELK